MKSFPGRGWVWRLAQSALLWVAAVASAGATDLWQAFLLAKSNDPTFAAAQSTLQVVLQRVPEARSALLPLLSANGNYGYTDGQTQYTGTPEVRRGFSSYQWALQLSQPLVHVSEVFAYDESRSLADQAQAQFALARQDLIVRLAQAYCDVLVAEEALEAAVSQLQAIEEQLAAADSSYRAGVASVTDVEEARSRAAAARSQQVATSTDLDVKRAVLEAITGPITDGLAALRTDAVIPDPDPQDVRLWRQRAAESNPNVVAAEAAVKAANYELDRMRAARLPTVDLVGSYGANFSSGNIIDPLDYASRVHDKQIALQVNVPLVDGGGLQAQVGEARAKWRQAQAQHDAAERQAVLDARQAYAKITSGLAQVSALRSAVSAGENSVKGNRAGYRLGIRINSDVLNAEQQLYASTRDLAEARYDTLLQGLRLKAAAGDLRESDVRALDGLFTEGRRVPDQNDRGSSPGSR